MTARILLLGGVTEALAMARQLGPRHVYSLAGIGRVPQGLQCQVRVGGYGGVEGLTRYLREAGMARGLRGWVARAVLHYIRHWDRSSAVGVDHIVANSDFVRRHGCHFSVRRRCGCRATVRISPSHRPRAPHHLTRRMVR
jgi:hypothetical protein